MKTRMMILAATAMLLAACSPKAGKTTKVVGQFGEDAVCDFSLGNPDVPPPR